jgi:subtilisin-like proprotein convertase family protein
MNNKILSFLILIIPSFAFTQIIWKKSDESNISVAQRQSRDIIPDKYITLTLNHLTLEQQLAYAPLEFTGFGQKTEYTIELPMPDGNLESFVVWQAPVMESELAARYPLIKSYKAYKKSDKTVTARFSTGPNGFRGAIRAEEGLVYIDPYSAADTNHYIVYYTSDHADESLKDRVLCGTDESVETHKSGKAKWGTKRLDGKMELRKYRLALACTGEWGAVRVTKEKALADMVAFVERANIVFEAELGLTTVLIAKNDELIFLDGDTDPYTNSNQGLSLVGQNTSVLNVRIGFGAYEIGHVFSICNDVGGVASGNICTPGKGAGVTCHNSPSISNGIVLVFNHEVGHQMTAAHTFNNCPGQEGQLSQSGYEPGGGSTIMAYPNACGTSNLGVSRDDYYHVISLDQMLSFTNSAGADAYECAEKVDINNFIPVISMPYTDGFYIPKSTPFFLKASAEDANGDIMKFNWDQFDNQTSSPLGDPVGNAPIFRSLKPTTHPARYFPNVSRILNGQFTDKTELLPTYGRELTFRFVVRDNNPLGNASVWDEMKFRVADNAGPFILTYPVLDYKLKIGEKLNVTWDVANTDIAPVNCKFVDIYIALNNSLDFDSENLKLVSKSTPNDGQETIIVPNVETIRARIVVKASDNIFLTTGLYNSRIDIPTVPTFFMDVTESNKTTCLPENVTYEFSTVGFSGLTDKIKFEVVSGLPVGAIATFDNDKVTPGETTKLSINLESVSGTADYEVLVRSYVEGVDTIERRIRLGITSTDIDWVGLVSPENGAAGVGPTQKYNWDKKPDAISYELQVATSPSFLPETMVLSKITSENSFNSNTFLDKATIYFWRVRASNSCRDGQWSDIFAFNTESLSCVVAKSGELTINISQSGTPKVEAIVNVFNEGAISDINIKNIKAEHQWTGDLAAYLMAPTGQEVLLWNRKCGSSKGLFLGIDDQSNEFFQCPINTGRIYRPESPLSAFHGVNMKGNWTLRLEDKASGNGGKLQNFDLELCANIVLNPPVLTRNEVLKIHPKDTRDIDRILLLSEDINNSAAELKYVLVKSPTKGVLTVNGSPVVTGSQFTQDDIDKNKLKYLHTSESEDDDDFSFVVSDGQGGWISITDFIIEVDEDFSSSVKEELLDERILVYPNPAQDVLNISMIDRESGQFRSTISDMTGRMMYSDSFSGTTAVYDIQSLQSGVYLIKIEINGKSTYRKFVKN